MRELPRHRSDPQTSRVSLTQSLHSALGRGSTLAAQVLKVRTYGSFKTSRPPVGCRPLILPAEASGTHSRRSPSTQISELYLGSTQFTSSSFPSTIWDSYAGLSFVGQNFIEIGTAEYTGNSAQTPPVRWGDYNTMVFDPYAIPPGGEGSWWSVEEISQGGSDQFDELGSSRRSDSGAVFRERQFNGS